MSKATHRGLAVLDNRLDKRPYVFGEDFSDFDHIGVLEVVNHEGQRAALHMNLCVDDEGDLCVQMVSGQSHAKVKMGFTPFEVEDETN